MRKTRKGCCVSLLSYVILALTFTSQVTSMPQGGGFNKAVIDIVKNQYISNICDKKPSATCADEVKDCMEFLGINEQLENASSGDIPSASPKLDDLTTTCGTMSLPKCLKRLEKCGEILSTDSSSSNSDITISEVDEPVTEPTSTTTTDPTAKPPTSTTTAVEASTHVPVKEVARNLCLFKDIPKCTQRAEKCLELVGPSSASNDVPTPELIECSSFLQQFSEDLEGPPPLPTPPGEFPGPSFPQPPPGIPGPDFPFPPPGIPGPGSPRPPPGIPGPDFPFPPPGIPGPDFPFPPPGIPGPGSFPPPGIPGSNISQPSPKQLAIIMCANENITNCRERVEKCLSRSSSPEDALSVPAKELIECSKLVEQLSEKRPDLFTTGEPSNPSIPTPTPAKEESVSPVGPGPNDPPPNKLMASIMCASENIPNCQERVEKCLQLIGPSAKPAATPTTEMIECSVLLQPMFAKLPGGGPGGASPSTDKDEPASGTSDSLPAKSMASALCASSTTSNCRERAEKCLILTGPSAAPVSIPTAEMIECSSFLEPLFKKSGLLS